MQGIRSIVIEDLCNSGKMLEAVVVCPKIGSKPHGKTKKSLGPDEKM